MSEAWESTRDFGHIKHPKAGSPALCAFTQYIKIILIAIVSNILYYVYFIIEFPAIPIKLLW